MFASCQSTTPAPIQANLEDGTVDIRAMLGKCGRSTEADKPVVIVTEISKEKENAARSHILDDEFALKEEEEKQPNKALVLDSRAFFLRKISVDALCKDRPNAPKNAEEVDFMTCPDVLRELKDEQTQLYLQSLPFELKIHDPNESALKFVVKFAKETGDYQSLSATDLRVMALAYYIVQQRGEANLCRKSPPELTEFKPKWVNTKPTKPKKQTKKKNAVEIAGDGWEVQEEKTRPIKKKFRRNIKRDFYPEAFLRDLAANNQTAQTTGSGENQTKPAEAAPEAVEPQEPKEEEIPHPEEEEIDEAGEGEDYEEEDEEAEDEEEENFTAEDHANEDQVSDATQDKTADDVLVQRDGEGAKSDSEEEDDECDDEWITPDNLQTYLHCTGNQKAQTQAEEDKSRKISVEVVTSDFAMQNVLMQIGIPVVSLEGVEIRKIKRFKLRCDGCKTINQRVDVEFCQKCGGHTLSKVSVFSNSNGEITFFKGKRLRKNNRGVQFSIPVPKGGRDKNAMILREDQLWVGQNKLRMKEKQREEDRIKNKLGDHFNDYVSFEHTRKENKKFSHDLVYGYGKKNPNVPNKKYSKKKRK